MRWTTVRRRAMVCVVLAAMVGTTVAAFAQGREDLAREARTLGATHAGLERESAQALEGLLANARRDMAGRRADLLRQLRGWTEDPRDASIADINQKIQEALPLAEAAGLDVATLTRLYELTRKVVRTADFPPPRETNPILGSTLAQRVSDTMMWALGEERILAEAAQRHQQYRVDLYKRAMLAYLRALLALPSPPPDGCMPSGTREASVRGHRVRLVDCPDPAVEDLRRYLDAVRTIQSGDTHALVAQAEELVAEQQLVADMAAGIPVVSDALDIYAVWSGEDLAGTPLSPAMRGFTGVLAALPIVGPSLAEQVMKRSPGARAAAETLAAFLEAAQETLGVIVVFYVRGTGELASSMAEGVAWRWGLAVDQLDDMVRSLRSSRRSVQALTDAEKAQLRIYQTLRDAAQDKIALDALPEAYRKRAAASAAHRAALNVGAAQAASVYERVAMSGLVGKHAEILADVARETQQILIVRPVNRSATALIEGGWATKGMGVKLKSADAGAVAGAIPVNQRLNKTGTALREAEERLAALEARAGASAGEVAALKDEVAALNKKLDEGLGELDKCFKTTPPCARKVPHPSGVMEATDAAGKDVLVVSDGRGGWLDAETDLPVAVKDPPQPLLILGDPVSGKPLTADYDLLATADQGRLTTPRFDADTGFITEGQKRTVQDVNDRVRRKAEAAGAEGANVMHHGAEQNFPKSPGVDYPLTAFQPNGEIVTILKCDERCMKRWCETTRMCDPGMVPDKVRVDPDRLAKDYFHDMRHKDFNLYPNPKWSWGPYNAIGGWLLLGRQP